MGKHKRPDACKRCGRAGTERTPISLRGLCVICRTSAVAESVTDMVEKTGEHHDKWVASMKAYHQRQLDALASAHPQGGST